MENEYSPRLDTTGTASAHHPANPGSEKLAPHPAQWVTMEVPAVPIPALPDGAGGGGVVCPHPLAASATTTARIAFDVMC